MINIYPALARHNSRQELLPELIDRAVISQGSAPPSPGGVPDGKGKISGTQRTADGRPTRASAHVK